MQKRTSDSDEMFSDADDSLAVGTRGQTAWDFVSIPSKNTDAADSSSSPDKNKAPNIKNGKMMKNEKKEKEQQAIDVQSEIWCSQLLHSRMLHDLSCKFTTKIATIGIELLRITNIRRAKQHANLCQICNAKGAILSLSLSPFLHYKFM